MEIPYRQLTPDALRGVLEEIASRDGTEFTAVAEKVARLQALLERGKARLVYDALSESCNVLEKP